MNTTAKVIVFGTVSGLIWSTLDQLIDFSFDDVVSSKESVLNLLAGVLTGVAVSLILKDPLTRLGYWWTLFFGLVALPVGAFIFGTIFSFTDLQNWLNGSQYGLFQPILIGGYFALLSVASYFAIFLFPLAILTTFTLRFVIHFGEKQTPKI